MVNVAMVTREVGPSQTPNAIYVLVIGGTTTGRQLNFQIDMNLTDSISILNTNMRAAAIAYLQENYPDDTNWNLATYFLFGSGQIIL